VDTYTSRLDPYLSTQQHKAKLGGDKAQGLRPSGGSRTPRVDGTKTQI